MTFTGVPANQQIKRHKNRFHVAVGEGRLLQENRRLNRGNHPLEWLNQLVCIRRTPKGRSCLTALMVFFVVHFDPSISDYLSGASPQWWKSTKTWPSLLLLTMNTFCIIIFFMNMNKSIWTIQWCYTKRLLVHQHSSLQWCYTLKNRFPSNHEAVKVTGIWSKSWQVEFHTHFLVVLQLYPEPQVSCSYYCCFFLLLWL